MPAVADTVKKPRHLDTISRSQWEHYQEHGYIIVRDVFTQREVREMLAECDAIHRGDYGELYGGAIQVEPEFEEAVKANPELAKLARKITFVVERSVVFRKSMLKRKMVGILQDILGPDILLFRDILMMKPAKVGSKMPWHQDSNYWPIRPTELCSAWTALDEATVENGCMRVVPGSHTLGLIAPAQPGSPSLADEQVDPGKVVDVPLTPGSCLLFHSRLLHGSEPNRSDRPRRAFITSFMSARSTRVEHAGRTRYFLVSGRTYPGCVMGAGD